jgi:hypothetical protein
VGPSPRILITALIFAALFLSPAVAFAVDMDFYTYGGFEPVVDAFTQMSLIFGDSSYQALYYTMVICGIGFGATAAYITLIGGRGNNILGWAPIAALGISIYIGLFVPKGNLVVYDPVFNKFQTVPNVPNGVVIVAGSLNAIERGLVEIVSNSASPTAYQTQAGGIGFMGLYNLATLPATASNSFLDMNINRYIQDCVSFALNNPASGLTVDELRKTTTSFATSFAKAKNPAITTLYYSAANPQGLPQACDADWTQISTTDLTAAALQNNINSACSTLNYDITDPLQLGQCQANLINLATAGNLTTGDINSLMQQIYLYNRLDQYYQSGNTTAITNYSFLMNASGSMKAADEWIPVLKAILTAIAVSLIPLLAIFIPTPICGRTLNLMFGLFLWLTLWGVCDAIIHQFALSYGFKVWNAVRQNDLGMDALYFFPNMTVKALGMFGTLRMGGLLLATALATMLTRFGGSVMGMLAGNITGQIQAAGTGAEWKTTDPSGRAQSIEANTRALPTIAWASSHSLSTRGGEVYADKSAGTEAYKAISGDFGGPGGAAHMGALGKIGREVGYAGKGEAMQGGSGGLPGAFGLGKFNASADLTKTADIQSAFGSPDSYGRTQAASPAALANVAAASGILPEELALSMARFKNAMGYGEQQAVHGFLGKTDDIQAGKTLGNARGTQGMELVAHSNQVRAAANHAAPDSWKSDPSLYDSGRKELTDRGVNKLIGAMGGHIEYSTPHGRATLDLDSNGRLVKSSEVGIMPGNDKKGIEDMAKRLDDNGLYNEASAVRTLGEQGKSFGYGTSYDSQGSITGFTGERGGKFGYQDRGYHDEGQDVHLGNIIRKGSDIRIGEEIRRGDSFDFGIKSREGDMETYEQFRGNIDGHNFTNATAEIRGNTFAIYGETDDDRWEEVSGHTWKDANGNRHWSVMKGHDDSGMSFTPQSAMDSVLNKHSVPESAMKDYQTKTAFAAEFVEALQQLRSLSDVYGVGSKGGGTFSIGMGTSDNSPLKVHASFGGGSEFNANEQQTINKQMRDVMKVMDLHDNTPQGRKDAAEELGKIYRDNAGGTGTRYFHFNEGPWVPK